MNGLVLVRQAATAACRRGVFGAPADAPVDPSARDRAGALAAALGGMQRGWVAPCTAAAETAELAGLVTPDRMQVLASPDFGAWNGRTAAEVASAHGADALAAWRADPAAAPHGGESLAAVVERVGPVVARAAEADDGLAVVADGVVVRALLVAALRLPAAALWRFDVAPASVSELRHADGRWTLTALNVTPAVTLAVTPTVTPTVRPGASRAGPQRPAATAPPLSAGRRR